MPIEAYKALYDAIVAMSFDIEGDVNDTDIQSKLPYVKAIIECVNDVPSSRVAYAEKLGIKIPEVE